MEPVSGILRAPWRAGSRPARGQFRAVSDVARYGFQGISPSAKADGLDIDSRGVASLQSNMESLPAVPQAAIEALPPTPPGFDDILSGLPRKAGRYPGDRPSIFLPLLQSPRLISGAHQRRLGRPAIWITLGAPFCAPGSIAPTSRATSWREAAPMQGWADYCETGESSGAARSVVALRA